MTQVIVSGQHRDKPVYGFDNVTNAGEVSALIDTIRANLGADMNKTRIFVLSGTHGEPGGSLSGEKVFFLEDKSKELQTVTAVNVGPDTPPNTWRRYFEQEKAILILAWCYSDRWTDLNTYLH